MPIERVPRSGISSTACVAVVSFDRYSDSYIADPNLNHQRSVHPLCQWGGLDARSDHPDARLPVSIVPIGYIRHRHRMTAAPSQGAVPRTRRRPELVPSSAPTRSEGLAHIDTHTRPDLPHRSMARPQFFPIFQLAHILRGISQDPEGKSRMQHNPTYVDGERREMLRTGCCNCASTPARGSRTFGGSSDKNLSPAPATTSIWRD